MRLGVTLDDAVDLGTDPRRSALPRVSSRPVNDPARPRERLALAALVAGALGIAFAPIFVRESETGPVATAVHRMFLALPLLAPLAVRERRRRPEAPSPWSRAHLGALVACGLFFAGDLAVWHWSIHFTSVTNATLFANFAPIFVTFVAWAWLGERVGALFVVGLATALAGAAVLLQASIHLGGTMLRGDLLGIATAVFYAAYQLTVKRLRASLGTFALMFSSTLFSAVALLAIALLERDTMLPATGRGWVVVLLLAWVSQVAGQSLIAYGLAHLPASFSSVTLLVQPVAAATLARWWLGEGIGPAQVAGGALVLVGILLARRASRA